MTTIDGVTYLTIAEARALLPFRMHERTLRRLIRASGHYLEHRRQLVLTEADLAAVLAHIRTRQKAAPPCRSSSSAEARSSTSRVQSAASVTSKARELARASMLKRTG